MADRPAPKPIESDSEWQTVDPSEWQTVSGGHSPAPMSTAPPDSRNGFQKWVDEETKVEPANARPGLMGRVETAIGNVGGGFLSPLSILAHPIQTGKMAVNSINQGMSPAPNRVFADVPSMQESLAEGLAENPSGTLENLAGATASGKLMGDAGNAGMGAARGAKAWMRPTPSPEVVPPVEMASRKLAQAILPPTKDASGFIRAAQKEVPNVLEHGRSTGNPLRTQLEFSKAAQGHAQNVRDFYMNKILGPNDKVVDVNGTGYGGVTTGEGHSAKLSDIDNRIVELNKQLDAPTLNSDDARRALASKASLQAEHDALVNRLHGHLSKATGLSPEQIADIRQQVGRSYELANDTDAAVTTRGQQKGRLDQGPLHWEQIPARMTEFMRGGPQAIADRQFMRAIKNFPGNPTPLPEINPPQTTMSARTPLWAGIETEDRPAPTLTGDVENARALMSERLAARRSRMARNGGSQ